MEKLINHKAIELLFRQINLLLILSLKQYRHEIRQKLIKHKQLIIIICALLFPTLGSLKYFFIDPLSYFFEKQAKPQIAFIILFFYQMIGARWALLQKDAILGGNLRNYLNTLPITKSAYLTRNILILLLANVLLYIPLLIALTLASSNSIISVKLLKLLFIMETVIILQLAFLYKKRHFYLNLLWLDLYFSLTLDLRGSHGIISLVFLLIVGIWLIQVCCLEDRFKAAIQQVNKEAKNSKDRKYPLLIFFLKLNNNYLFNSRNYNYKLVIAALILLTAIASVVSFSGSIDAACDVMITAAIVMSTLCVFYYEPLFIVRKNYARFIDSLPISRVKWFLYDFLSLQLLPIFLTLIPAFILIFSRNYFSISVIFAPVAIIISGILNYISFKFFKNHTIFMSLLIFISLLMLYGVII